VFGDGRYYGSQLTVKGEGPLGGWFEAVKNTQAYREIADIIKLSREGSLLYTAREQQHANYLIDRLELFARSYHQYIAQKSGNATLLGPIREIVRDRHWTHV